MWSRERSAGNRCTPTSTIRGFERGSFGHHPPRVKIRQTHVKYQVELFELHLEIGGVGARMERGGCSAADAPVMAPEGATRDDGSIDSLPQNLRSIPARSWAGMGPELRARAARLTPAPANSICDASVECSAVVRSGTAPRTHAGSATCGAPADTRAKRTWSRGCQA